MKLYKDASIYEYLNLTIIIRYVIHTASPVPLIREEKKLDENLMMKAAVSGTNTILKTCLKNGVKKLILTSTVETLSIDGNPGGHKERHFKENNWSNPTL